MGVGVLWPRGGHGAILELDVVGEEQEPGGTKS